MTLLSKAPVASTILELGLLIPALTRIRPGLTPLAACGLATIMLLAALFHIGRGEYFALPINLALGVSAAFVAWGRWQHTPITLRSSSAI